MYRPSYGSFRAGGYQGRVPRAGSDSDLISRHAGTTEQQVTARMKHVAGLLVDLIRDESDAEKKYDETLKEISELPSMRIGEVLTTTHIREIIKHISEQEHQHKTMLERILPIIQERVRVHDLAGGVG